MVFYVTIGRFFYKVHFPIYLPIPPSIHEIDHNIKSDISWVNYEICQKFFQYFGKKKDRAVTYIKIKEIEIFGLDRL